jgi:hypothetical protein
MEASAKEYTLAEFTNLDDKEDIITAFKKGMFKQLQLFNQQKR